ncbi:phosphotransferase family protein [Deinococcus hohokamensis]|uniref:Phosphotransferase family protein n=1 Tax=Deinococcus hohokamensis TaxID=309883 RepID=A0ABV9IB98_9DEIO
MNAEACPDLAAARDLLGPQAHWLATGASCVVFTNGPQVARLGLGTYARLRVQVQLQQALAGAGVPVARVLEAGALASGRAYSVEVRLHGDGGAPTGAGWADLGQALQALHALPHSGFGLLEDRPDRLKGQATSAAEGLLTRLSGGWPLTPAPLTEEPLVAAAPDLCAPLARREAALRALPAGRGVVSHTDLHAGQVLWRGGRLAGLLDFGDAAVGPVVWDSASLAFFHGWAASEAAGLPGGRDAALMGVLLAIHRARRARTAGQLARAVTFARMCLTRR